MGDWTAYVWPDTWAHKVSAVQSELHSSRSLWSFYRCRNATDAFACLVAVDSDTLNNANDVVAASAFYGTYIFVPVVDGTFIVERPTVTMDRQVVNGVCLMCGALF
jgi:carboxylesterase type B